MTTFLENRSRRIDHLRAALQQPAASSQVLASLMESLLELGDRSAALESYRRYSSTVRFPDRRSEQHLRSVYERALWSAPLADLPTNVPSARHVIVGRDAETHEIVEQIRKVRLVSLTGPGGVGKTRIAIEAARRLLPEYADGVWWIDLTAVTDGGYCAEHLAQAIGAPAFAQNEAGLLHFLSTQSAVLVFDRCEHIAPAVRSLIDRIATAAPNIRVIATSRTPLGAAGEREMRIPPLSVPEAAATSRAAVLRSMAVQVFIQRATAVDARFALTDENAATVAELCRKLEGIPLAIELAASSTGHLPLERIAQRMVTAQPNLEAAIAGSYELLDPPAREVLNRLGIFVSPFTFEEASAVCEGDAAPSLKRLIDSSLLQMRPSGGVAEYYLLDSTRDFIVKRAGTACRRQTSQQLLAFYGEIARGANTSLLERAFANVAQVLAILAGDGESIAQRLALLATAGARFGIAGHVDETAALCEAAIADTPPQLRDAPEYGDALRTLAWFDNRRGRFEEAVEHSKEAIRIARRARDVPRIVRGLSNLYIVAIHVGDYALARASSAEALELSLQTGDPATISNAIRAAAGSHVATGNFAKAVPLYEQFLRLDLERVPKPVFAMALHDYAVARLHLGETAAAAALARRSVEVSVDAGDRGTETDAYNCLGQIALTQGDLDAAYEFYRQAFALANRPGAHPITLVRTLEGCAACALRDDQMESVAQILGFADQLLQRLNSPRQPFERPRAEALHAAVASRLGEERFRAALLVGRTRSFPEACAALLQLQPGSAPPERAERFAALTSREREIAELAAHGASNRQISEHLNLSVRTVENHLAAIYKKLGIRTRGELIAK